jgi:DNA-binding NarL/FixJ family response regulator
MTMGPTVRVLLVDDHQIVREGLRTLFNDEPGIHVVGEAASAAEAVDAAARLKPDVVILDLIMPGGGSIDAIRTVRERHPSVQVLVLSSFAGDHQVHDALKAGAIGYMLKDVSRADLVRAIRSLYQGQPALHPEAQRHLVRGVSAVGERTALAELTERERGVLGLIARGRSNKSIAAELNLSEGTVKGYVSIILGKLGVEDRTQAALYAVKHGLVQASEL